MPNPEDGSQIYTQEYSAELKKHGVIPPDQKDINKANAVLQTPEKPSGLLKRALQKIAGKQAFQIAESLGIAAIATTATTSAAFAESGVSAEIPSTMTVADHILEKARVSYDANQRFFPDWYNAPLGQPLPADYFTRAVQVAFLNNDYKAISLAGTSKSFPTTFIIDPNGNLVDKKIYLTEMLNESNNFSYIAPILNLNPGDNPNPDLVTVPTTTLLGNMEKNIVFRDLSVALLVHPLKNNDWEIDSVEDILPGLDYQALPWNRSPFRETSLTSAGPIENFGK